MNFSDAPARIGIVGTGGIARRHADNVRSNARCTLVGGVDVSADAREAFRADYGVPTFVNYEELSRHGVDAIVVATPNAFHAQYAIAALNDGVHVLCEKPLAATLTEAERVVEAAARSDAIGMVGFNNRFTGPAELVSEATDAGRFGEIDHVEARWIRRRGIPGRGGWFTRSELSGGGAMIDIGVHVLDLALSLLDYPTVAEVSAVTRSNFGHRGDYTSTAAQDDDHGPDGFDVEDSVTAFIRCDGGRTISLDAAWAANRADESVITVVGTDAGAEYDIAEQAVTFFDVDRTAESGDPLPTPVERGPPRDGHAAELSYFVDVVDGRRKHTRNTIEQGFAVQRVIDAVYESSETGRAVSLAAPSRPEHESESHARAD